MIGDDIKKCWNYNMIVFWNFVDLVKYSFTDPFLTAVTTGLIMHKAPIVAKVCNYTLNDVSQFDLNLGYYSSDMISLTVLGHIGENLVFNTGDILYHMIEAKHALERRDYHEFGNRCGNIVLDIFYLNPYDGVYIWQE